MEKTFRNLHDRSNQVEHTQDFSIFDDVMEKVTSNMFKVIIFGGIPFFLWVAIQAFLKF